MKTQKEISNLDNSGESYFEKWYLKTPEDLQRGKAEHSPLAARARHREHFYLSGHQTSSQCDHMTLKCKCLYYVNFALYNNIKSLSIHILKLKGEKHYMRFFENAHIIHKVSTSKPAPTVSNYTAVCAAHRTRLLSPCHHLRICTKPHKPGSSHTAAAAGALYREPATTRHLRCCQAAEGILKRI